MAYKKTYRRKRQVTAWYNKKYTPGDVAAAAWKGVKQIKSIINSEKHFHTVGSAPVIDNSGSVLNLTSIAQGDTIQTRTGNSIFIRSISMKFNPYTLQTGVATHLRLMLIQDNQQVSDTVPSIPEMLESVDVLSHLKVQTLGRFSVLWDKNVLLDQVSNRQKYFEYKNHTIQHHVRYNGTTTADIQKGGLYLVAISDESTNTPLLPYNIRIGFYDN